MTTERKRCDACCKRVTPYEIECCSHGSCPCRRTITAAPKEDGALEHNLVNHGYVSRRPRLSDED